MTAAAVRSPTTSALHNLLLARLAVPRKSPYTVHELTKALQPFLNAASDAEAKEAVAAAVQTLSDASQVVRDGKRITLTEAGQAETLRFLGLTELPAKLRWDQCLNNYLLPRLLDIQPSQAATRKKMQSAGGIAAVLLKHEHNLPLEGVPSLTAALSMVLCRELGVPPVTKVNAKVLSRWLIQKKNGERRHISEKEDLSKHLLYALVGGSKADLNSLRRTTILRLLQNPADPVAEPIIENVETPFNLSGFAEAVLEAARTTPTGRFGENKVFIHHVWKQLETARAFPHLDYATFQQHLVAANQEGLLHLSRLDLVDLFAPEEVAAAETRHHHAVFHFVQI